MKLSKILEDKKFKIFEKLFIYLCLIIITFSSMIYLYDNRNKTKSKIISYFSQSTYESKNENDYYWAKKIMEGGYILHFRHAERDKWIDVVNYDSLDSHVHNKGDDQTRYPENDYFTDAVCLNERGKVQAKAMAEHLEHINFKVGYVISSTSCRARQTANLVFGGFDEMKTILVHKGPYRENEKKRIEKLKNLYLSLPIMKDKNTIVSAHNSVVNKGMFVNDTSKFENEMKELSLEEGGFFVISKKNGQLKLEHMFYVFSHFSKNFHKR
tara:strand:+ start:221 stop:1027 length:807 start_codon:yes stop_codon:yes gene_type:complete